MKSVFVKLFSYKHHHFIRHHQQITNIIKLITESSIDEWKRERKKCINSSNQTVIRRRKIHHNFSRNINEKNRNSNNWELGVNIDKWREINSNKYRGCLKCGVDYNEWAKKPISTGFLVNRIRSNSTALTNGKRKKSV